MIQIHIVTGDVDGVGLEVSLKALKAIGVKKNVQFCLWRSSEKYPHIGQDSFSLFRFSRVNQFSECADVDLIEVCSSDSPIIWVKKASQLCLEDAKRRALVTAPLSKIQIKKDGFQFKGHTDLLKEVSGCPFLFMCFLGEKFNVVLLTDHQPLNTVQITPSLLQKGIEETLLFRKKLSLTKPIGVLGLNPHAGEEGILGSEEQKVFLNVLDQYSKKDVVGPLVPDTAFQPANWNKYSFYLCAYHDQGLIPFKMTHPQEGIQTTLGLPFVRTSVDHGTAKDIFGQNKANSSSMKKAIETALSFLNH
ncbi:MAG: 4-hydroxythreonine-4-phosphate dehydrogenase PdxA [Bdellovibrionales bacterium]|nr:4-hydroxythreonine-4-phosphate dehydrogenase PdxA [Bdellovibrionales bacterium]